ncbi:unnamed protein product [Rotaria magnacalcarata]|uniref:Nuclear receptor domain-containing protein n=1 Tax=Rotaria magnacalcarata TaxID=392030 RepID=A0A8S3G3K9_9BILA|nr:unnamed protein product [Rotaria magnacalcarata]
MNEVTNETNNTASATVHTKTPDAIRKRKIRRVKSIIRSSIEKISNEKEIQQIGKIISTNTSVDKRPFPFGHCRVCADKATGAHYGVPTCEGCKVI